MTKKHIVHVVTRLLRAGSEENVIATCLGHLKNGHRVTLVFGQDHDPKYHAELGERIDLVCVKSLVHAIRPAFDTRATYDMWRLFLRLRPDIVHTHQSKAGIIGRLAARLAGVPHVVHGVHIAPFLNVGRANRLVYLAVERIAARVTDAFISVSCGMRDAYISAGIGERDKHFVVYSGMPLDDFFRAEPPQNWRQILGVSEGESKPPVVLVLAALELRKRHRELVSHFANVVEAFPDARLLIAGRGEEDASIRTAVAIAGLQDNIKIIGFHDQPEQLVALADVCVLASSREGLPRVVVQYIAGGKPVVVSRVAGIEEIVKDGVSGFVTSADDVGEVAQSIKQILSDDVLREKLASGARETDVSQWQEESLVLGTESVYEKLYETKGASAKPGRTRRLATMR